MASVLNQWLAKEYISLVSDQEGVVVLSLYGLTVDEAERVRNSIRESGSSLRMVKNRIAKQLLQKLVLLLMKLLGMVPARFLSEMLKRP